MAAGLAIALSTAQPAAQSQSIQSVSTRELRSTTAAKIATANVVEQPPTIDGNVLDDPAWADAVAVSGFRQSTPNAGEAATERTEVRVVFTDDAVYFGVVCYDRDPSSIIVSDSRRDSSMNDADSFQMVLDTFHDQQNGFVFGTTPAGQEYDGQVVNEGEGRGAVSRQRRRRVLARQRRWLQPQLGRRVAGTHRNLRRRLERRVRHSVQDHSLR